MFYEGSISQAEEDLREPLYQALHQIDEAKIEELMNHEQLKKIVSLSDDGENPTTGVARRLLRYGADPLLLTTGGETVSAKWPKFTRDVASLLKAGDEEVLAQYFRSQPWTTFREVYAKTKVSGLLPITDRDYILTFSPSSPSSVKTECSPSSPLLTLPSPTIRLLLGHPHWHFMPCCVLVLTLRALL